MIYYRYIGVAVLDERSICRKRRTIKSFRQCGLEKCLPITRSITTTIIISTRSTFRCSLRRRTHTYRPRSIQYFRPSTRRSRSLRRTNRSRNSNLPPRRKRTTTRHEKPPQPTLSPTHLPTPNPDPNTRIRRTQSRPARRVQNR